MRNANKSEANIDNPQRLTHNYERIESFWSQRAKFGSILQSAASELRAPLKVEKARKKPAFGGLSKAGF